MSNAVIALNDINERSVNKGVFDLSSNLLSKLLAALNECTEYDADCPERER